MLRLRASLLILQAILTYTDQSPVPRRVVRGEAGQDLPGIPGRPGTDYPTLWKVPKTSFSCVGRLEGFYGDVEARCQVFHVCGLSSGLRPQQSFLCPNGTLFNAQVKTCDWWNNVECGSIDVLQETLQAGEETHRSSHHTQLNIDDDSPKARKENAVKINFDRSKFLLNAFNMRINTNEGSGSNFSNIFSAHADKDDYYGARSVVRNKGFPQEAFTDKEVNIRPRIKYTHSLRPSSTKSPIFSVTSYLGPTENLLLESKDLSEPSSKFTIPERKTERQSLKMPRRLFQTSKDIRTGLNLNNRELTRKNNLDLSKYTNKLNQTKINSEKSSPREIEILDQYSSVPTDDLYSEMIKLIKMSKSYSVEDNTDKTEFISKPKEYSSTEKVDMTSSFYGIYREGTDFKPLDRKISMHKVINGYRSKTDDSAPIEKLVGSDSKNGSFPLVINESKQDTEDKPGSVYSTAERHYSGYFNDKQDQKHKFPTSDMLMSFKKTGSYKNKLANLSDLDHSTQSSNYSFAFDEFVNKQDTSKSENILPTGLNDYLVEENDNFQNLRTHNIVDGEKLVNTNSTQNFIISKQNLTYEEYTDSLFDQKSNIQPELSRNTKTSTNSYVSVPSFSSFPELYTSSVLGYYITELPPEIKRSKPNLKETYDDEAKNRITRLDGDSHKLVSTTENPLETKSNLFLNETKPKFATTNPISTTLHKENDNFNYNSNDNLNDPVSEETLTQTTEQVLPSEYNQEARFESRAFLGPKVSFENSHIAWPIFPPPSLFYSPYPFLKHSNSQFGAEQPLTFIPRSSRRRNEVNLNHNEMYYNHTKNNQQPVQATEQYSSSAPNFDLPEVLQQFLSNSPDKVVQSYQETESSTISIQPTVEVYSESTTSRPLDNANLKLDLSSIFVTPLEMRWPKTNGSPTFSSLPTTENVPLIDEEANTDFRKEFQNDDHEVVNHKSIIAPQNSQLELERTSKIFKPSKNHQSNHETSSTHNHSLKTVLEPPDVLNINSLLEATSKTTTEENFKDSEIVKSLSFDLDSPEDRQQFENAQSKGLLERL